MYKKSLEEQIERFFNDWNCIQMTDFLRDIIPILELYDNTDTTIDDAVGNDDEAIRNVRMVRMVYLVSRLADLYSGKLCRLKADYKNLWKKIEEVSENENSH